MPEPLRMRSGESRGRIAAYGVLCAGVALIVVAHWPGWLVPDSVANIEQARSGWIGDHRSAVTTWLWRQAWLVAGVGPGPALLTQLTWLAVGLYLLLRAVLSRVWAAALAVLVLLSPATFGLVGVVGRDMWFVSACVLAAGLACGATRWPRRWAAAAVATGIALATLAIASRQNGVTAAWPLMVALAAVAIPLLPAGASARLRRRPRVAALALGTTLTALALGATLAWISAVRDVEEYPEVYTQLWDLGWLTEQRDARFIPPLPRDAQPIQTPAEVRARWHPTTSIWMRWDPQTWRPPAPYAAADARRLRDAWTDAIRAHPLDYLRGRFELWKSQVGIGPASPRSWVYVTGNADNELGYDAPAFPALADRTIDYARAVAGDERLRTPGLLQHAWIYLLACLAGTTLMRSRFPAAVRVVGALAAAGVTAQLGLFLLAPSVQWRYQLLTVYAATVVALVSAALAARALRRRSATEPRPAARPAGAR